MAFKPIDPKRDDFRRYLERSSVLESLTKIFTRIVKERPENPLEYLRLNLGDALEQADNVAYLQSELKEAQSEIKRLREMIIKLQPEALDEPPQASIANVEKQATSEGNLQAQKQLQQNDDLAAKVETDLKIDDSADVVPATSEIAANVVTPESDPSIPSEVTKQAQNNAN